jgi:hypothetical protein
MEGIMDHTKILKRAWHILWQYRVLWIFGFFLALTTTSYSSTSTSYNFSSRDFNWDRSRYQLEELDPELQKDLEEIIEGMVRFIEDGIPSDVSNTVIAIAIGLALLILVLFIIGRILRYITETALIRMVDEYEETEEKRSIGHGFRLGWSRKAWRLFLIDLIIGIPVFLFFLVFLALILAPILLWATGAPILGGLGTIASIGLFFLLVCAAIVVGVVLNFLLIFIRRACVLQDLGVIESIKHGYLIVRQNLKDAGGMWLIVAGINIGWSIVIIPVGLLIVILGGLVAGVVALAVGGATGAFLSGIEPWIFAAVVGLLIFIVLVSVPLAFFNGLRVTFVSSTWTLTYRELTALEPARLKELPEPTPPEDDGPEEEQT